MLKTQMYSQGYRDGYRRYKAASEVDWIKKALDAAQAARKKLQIPQAPNQEVYDCVLMLQALANRYEYYVGYSGDGQKIAGMLQQISAVKSTLARLVDIKFGVQPVIEVAQYGAIDQQMRLLLRLLPTLRAAINKFAVPD